MSKSKSLAMTGMFAAVGVVINILSNLVPDTFGKVSLVYTFCYIAGIVLGGLRGAAAAAIADLLGHFISPAGAYIFQITLSNALLAALSGVIYRYMKGDFVWKICLTAVIGLLACSAGLTAWGLSMFYPITPPVVKSLFEGFSGGSFAAWSISQLITQPFIIAINVVLTILLYGKLKDKIPLFNEKPQKHSDRPLQSD